MNFISGIGITLQNLKVPDKQLDAVLVLKSVDLGGKGDPEVKARAHQLTFSTRHSKSDPFELAPFLFEVEFQVGAADNAWGADLPSVAE